MVSKNLQFEYFNGEIKDKETFDQYMIFDDVIEMEKIYEKAKNKEILDSMFEFKDFMMDDYNLNNEELDRKRKIKDKVYKKLKIKLITEKDYFNLIKLCIDIKDSIYNRVIDFNSKNKLVFLSYEIPISFITIKDNFTSLNIEVKNDTETNYSKNNYFVYIIDIYGSINGTGIDLPYGKFITDFNFVKVEEKKEPKVKKDDESSESSYVDMDFFG